MTPFLLVHQESEIARAIREMAPQADCEIIGQIESGREALFQLGSSPAKGIFFQLSQKDGDGFETIRQIQKKYPDVYIVLVLEGSEGGEVWHQILQLNLRDVITSLMDSHSIITTLKTAVQRAEEIVREGGARGSNYMVTVASARGGTGKSILATNLVISMAKLKVSSCLVDYSMNAGDFFTMLDFVPRNTIAEAISQGGGVDLPFLNTIVSEHPLGFKFLACPNQDFDYYNFDYDSAKNLLQLARKVSDFTVVDTGFSGLPSTQAAIEEADVAFLVTTRDLSRLLALQRYIKNLKDLGVIGEKIKVVINNAEVGTEISESEIESVVEHEITAYLPSNPTHTTFSINSGKPLAHAKGDLPLCKVIHRLAELCISHWQG